MRVEYFRMNLIDFIGGPLFIAEACKIAGAYLKAKLYQGETK